MTNNEANQCLLVMLLFDRREWPAPQVEAWTQALMRCTDLRAATHASETLVDETEPRDWSLHRWRQAYQDALRANNPELPRHEGPTISLKQHLATLERRAATDPEAAAEPAIWRRHRESPYVQALQQPA